MIIKKPSIWIVSGLLLFLVSIDNIGVALRYLSSDEDMNDKRGELQYISALTAQNYLEEGDELPVLNKYENAQLSQVPPGIPSKSDLSILNKEKTNISNFDKKVGQFKNKMSTYYLFEDIKAKKQKRCLLNLRFLILIRITEF